MTLYLLYKFSLSADRSTQKESSPPDNMTVTVSFKPDMYTSFLTYTEHFCRPIHNLYVTERFVLKWDVESQRYKLMKGFNYGI